MCVDYTNLNKACPKNSYHLLSIDELVDTMFGFRFLSFMDPYSGYNQIPMQPVDKEETVFITLMANYCYKVMPFGLKNARATYQRSINRISADHIGILIEVYIDDTLVKTMEDEKFLPNLETVFDSLCKHRIRLNPQKCAFNIEVGNFLGFMLTYRGIEVNLDKSQVILEMRNLTSVKEVQRLMGMIAFFSWFLAALAWKALPFFTLLRKKNNFRYEPITAIKAQALTDFLVEMVDEEAAHDPSWMLYVDKALSAKGCGVGVILEKEGDIIVELLIKFDFLVSNNRAEYEAFIVRLQLASDVEVTKLTIYSDSQIITS